MTIIRGVVCTRELVVELKLRRVVLPSNSGLVVEHALALIVGNIDALQSVEHGCHSLLRGVICIGTLVELEQMSKLVDDSILVTNDLIKAFDVAFLMVRQLVGVGMLRCESVSPGSVKQWKVTGS